ncbi:hypothetical protein Tco_0839269 [Tanacetum coccineum]|uniref:Retrovirus-related Pol polyprotein from transposon TNT 1-94-like beta-barrel domain-containing protein n=1 Tax=Tanacetum coccineum TaxID=301880 RepID=A0ABQ5ASZ1_9ASTR
MRTRALAPNINTSRTNINSVRPNINTGRTNINSLWPNVNTGRVNVNSVRPNVNTVLNVNMLDLDSRVLPSPQTVLVLYEPKHKCPSHAFKENWGSVLRPQQDHPLQNMVDRGIFDSGCSGHMTYNKDQLEDFEEFNGGSVTFGGSKGYISEAAKTLSRVASQKTKSIDKGRRYKRRKETKGNKVVTRLDFQEEVSIGYAELVNTGSIKVSTVSGKDKEKKAPMIIEEAPKKIRNKFTGGSVSLKLLDWILWRKKKSEKKNLICGEKYVESLCPINFEAKKMLKRFGEELQTKTSKRLKSDEAKDDESTKKTGKRRKQIARKGLHSDKTDEDESKASKDVDPISGTNIPINPIHVAIKPPSIATYKIIKQGKEGVYQIVREDGTDIVYINFGVMLKDITRDDLTELYRIVMNRYGLNGPEDELEKVLWEYLKNMFEAPLSTDPILSLLGKQRIISWRYYNTCRVHCLNLESLDIYMLTERKYPLTAEVFKAMLDKKLQGGKPDEDGYKLLKMMEKQDGIRK